MRSVEFGRLYLCSYRGHAIIARKIWWERDGRSYPRWMLIKPDTTPPYTNGITCHLLKSEPDEVVPLGEALEAALHNRKPVR